MAQQGRVFLRNGSWYLQYRRERAEKRADRLPGACARELVRLGEIITEAKRMYEPSVQNR